MAAPQVCNLLHVDPHVPRLVPSNIDCPAHFANIDLQLFADMLFELKYVGEV